MSARRFRSIDQPIVDLKTHPSQHVTVRVAATYMEADDRKVLRMIEAGSLPAVRVGREWRVLTEGLRRCLTQPVGISRSVSRSTPISHQKTP